MKHLDLFSGIGGFALACQWAEIETIGLVEIDKYCQKVLRKRFPNVPIVEDIRDVEKIKQVVENAIGSNGRSENRDITNEGWLASKAGREGIQTNPKRRPGVAIADNQPADFNGRTETIRTESPAILVTAGIPCQPFSVAGKQQSERDDRYLWPETLAVIEGIKPMWILLENVTGIINLALDTVLSDLEGAGYAYETLIIPACAVNAPHRRDRIWIMAHSNQYGKSIMSVNGGKRQGKLGIIADTTKQRLYSKENIGILEGTGSGKLYIKQSRDYRSDWWAVEPELGRVAYGIPHRVDRLKCLGNAIVPQVAYEIIKGIKRNEELDA